MNPEQDIETIDSALTELFIEAVNARDHSQAVINQVTAIRSMIQKGQIARLKSGMDSK